MEDVSTLLLATLEQERNPQVMVEMNVPTAQLEAVLKILPANTSPTILPTGDREWSVIKTLLSRKKLVNLTGNLMRLGVKGIVADAPVSVVG